MSLSLLKRHEWGAVPAVKWNHTTLPITRVYNIASKTRICHHEIDCIQICQKMQLHHIERYYGDIRFNFVIGGDGQVYEGRGWNNVPALPREYKNRDQRRCILIGYIGKWVNNDLPPLMVRASSDLIDYGLDNGYLDRNFISKNLFVDEFKERVVADIIRESRIQKAKKHLRNVKMVEEMGLNNELAREIDHSNV